VNSVTVPVGSPVVADVPHVLSNANLLGKSVFSPPPSVVLLLRHNVNKAILLVTRVTETTVGSYSPTTLYRFMFVLMPDISTSNVFPVDGAEATFFGFGTM
jgi:hypothetical protein